MNNDISQKLRLAIKTKLTTLDAYIDDEAGFKLHADQSERIISKHVF